MRILHELEQFRCHDSLEALSKKTKMSLQLVSYHIHGNEKSKGLKKLELVELTEVKGKTKVCLSTMGKLMMHGYVH
jgi:hypothetical protein